MNTQILLASRPVGEPTLDDFRTVQTQIPTPGAGEVLIGTTLLSLDPYMRGRMSAAKSYADPVAIGSVMLGQTVGEVLDSNDPNYQPGDIVVSSSGWQTHAVALGANLRKLDPSAAPVSYALGILGVPGQTAYCALLDIGKPQAGETVVVSAASGAVGSVAGQIAKLKGCRVVGIAGSDEKCDYVTKTLGFDACINRRNADLPTALAQECPNGIDVYFDNTAGAILEAVLGLINLGARIPLVGLIEYYNATTFPTGPYLGPLLINRAKIEGFLISDHAAHSADFARDVGGWLKAGRLHYKEDLLEGLEKAPEGLIGMLKGKNFGKLIVRVR
ncbi:MAG: NADP-dependent oxidoreductase [Candidatus Eremiobacteraeota bacterium]|nr:NADP-dependent oxidoreductase [Candidatus Eremiobacteraeota bacterium]